MKKPGRTKVFLLIPLLVVLFSVLLYWLLSSDLFRDPRIRLHERYQRELIALLNLNEKNETKIRGHVTHTNLGCESGQQNCHFVLQINSVSVNVYYRYTTQNSCLNEEAARAGEAVRNGESIDVFGKYYDTGSISTCDSPEYYIHPAD